ncbi:TolC family protein [Trinickia fusca]|uniref:Protein CyaE n=1 Tax=Trinickia fusca TaxID=2419777 RepID=A0A494X9V0_9BURK|nr:TolC family protein [Trinickia fusca]RKP46912.1 TolC family protein [Trinickia fusca]
MNARGVAGMALTAALLMSGRAQAFDPLFAMRTVPPNPGGDVIPAGQPCTFAAPGEPLTLVEAVERGLCNNPRTREAWAGVKAQAAAVGVARAAYLPSITGNWQEVRDVSSTRVNGHPELDSDTAANVRTESVTLNWLLFDFGGRAAALRNADSLLAAARATQDAAVQDTFATVAKDYAAVQAASGELDAAEEIERIAGDSVVAAQARVDRGVAPVTDALQAQTKRDEATFNRIRAEGNAKTTLGALASDMGLDPDVPLVVPPVTATPLPGGDWSESVVQLIDDVKRTHPAVLAAEARYEAALAKVAQTRSAGLPSVNLVAKYSRNNQPASLGLGIPTYPATGRDAYIGVQISIPFFEGGGRHYEVRQAEAEAERQQAAVDDARQQAALDMWTAWQSLRTATQNAAHTEAAVAIARRAFDAAEHRYRAGVGNILELLSTQTALATAQQHRIQALADWHTAKLALASKLGRLNMQSIADR